MAEAVMREKKRREQTRFGVLPDTVSLLIREPGSALTHFAGLILLQAASGPLIIRAREHGSLFTIGGICVFLLAACLLYAASTTYHTVVSGEGLTTVLRKLDHISISVMIAGTYTPICLTALRGKAGYLLLAAVWALALGGAVMKLFWITCPKWVSSVLYIAMGWLCVFAFRPLLRAVPRGAFLWLLAGGLLYTAGALIYASHPKKFDEKHIYFGSHEIFHVFIMLGTLCHYIVMYCYIALIP